MKLFVTGGCGFIGSNFVRLILEERPDWDLVNFDILTYAGNAENLSDHADNPRYTLVRGDIADRAQVEAALGESEVIINFAAESHVDRSIQDSSPFVRTNVMGTQVLLDVARERGVGKFIQIGTDEVYGALTPSDPPFTETTPLSPRNPYSATKAGADCLALAYHETHGLPVMVTRCPNNYGPWQFPEKLIPLMIQNALDDKPLPVYGDGMQVRDWIHVRDHNLAVLRVLEAGQPGNVYHVGSENEWHNIDVVKLLLKLLGKDESLIRYVEDRKGHDRRYAMALGRLRDDLGWNPTISFDEGLASTVEWYRTHTEWMERVRSGAYLEYYDRQYGARLQS